MGTLAQLEQSMKNLANRVERRGPAIQRQVALEILRLLIMGTPVGNKNIWLEPGKARAGYVGGRARANWFVGIGTANAGQTLLEDPSGASTLQRGADAINTVLANTAIHLNNNLPYIIPLNQGHSHQAPEGWIDRAIQGGVALLSTAKITEEGRT